MKANKKLKIQKLVSIKFTKTQKSSRGGDWTSSARFSSVHGATTFWARERAYAWGLEQYHKGITVSGSDTRDREARLYAKAYPIFKRWLNTKVD